MSVKTTFKDAYFHLVRNERASAYALMKEMDEDEWAKCDLQAREKGFTDFNELAAFYTIIDIGDDAPGFEAREAARNRFKNVLGSYSSASRATQVVRSATDRQLVLAAFKRSVWPIVVAAVLFALAAILYSVVPLVIGLLILVYGVFRFTWSFRTAKFLRHAYGLFRRYGVQGLEAEHRFYAADGTRLAPVQPVPEQSSAQLQYNVENV